MENFEKFIEEVRTQLQPAPRANATANTLEQLQSYLDDNVSLSDLAVAWSRLAVPQDSDDAPTAARRRTCSELATIAAQLDPSKGDVSAAIKAWQMWHTTFILSDDPRHVIMTSTFARELRELQA